jgi:uncharacterized Zn finger protein
MAWPRDFFPASRPIAVKGGIKARSKRGAFASKWWGQRWLAVLEALNLGGRLQRGRSYARKGQVVDLAIEPGTVRASVQGSRPKPYQVSIRVKRVGPKETERLAAELAKSPYVLAKLLTQEMPQDIERLFEATRLSLFPARASELHTECSCPDWSNPCKHIAAVYYLLGEEFDRDPFLIFRLRGIDLEALTGPPVEEMTETLETVEESGIIVRGAAPPESFWEGSRPDVDLSGPDHPLETAPLLRRLGNLPFWRGEQPLVEVLEPAHTAASAAALDLLAGSEVSGG